MTREESGVLLAPGGDFNSSQTFLRGMMHRVPFPLEFVWVAVSRNIKRKRYVREALSYLKGQLKKDRFIAKHGPAIRLRTSKNIDWAIRDKKYKLKPLSGGRWCFLYTLGTDVYNDAPYSKWQFSIIESCQIFVPKAMGLLDELEAASFVLDIHNYVAENLRHTRQYDEKGTLYTSTYSETLSVRSSPGRYGCWPVESSFKFNRFIGRNSIKGNPASSVEHIKPHHNRLDYNRFKGCVFPPLCAGVDVTSTDPLSRIMLEEDINADKEGPGA